ncbi:hypothetical protein BTI_1573 [Burkholderia thailandensis MSMB121]|uniref:hypothetical protein n=1 Tax=Burkholderia humptydooensis TaxID=430531 RepID=UPI0003280BE9|nr:hypothetical protein [Burkholderia humptydooensis]AGK47209.1 hypothetical protein BTI_1573 [Burkholderia thailandensis MSMB121]ATF36656.1 hypothetical protein CO709_27570 [Burkholderia thailandensis]
MEKKFMAGQRVKFNQRYVAYRRGTYEQGAMGTVARDQLGSLVSVNMDDGTTTAVFAQRLDLIAGHSFKVGDSARITCKHTGKDGEELHWAANPMDRYIGRIGKVTALRTGWRAVQVSVDGDAWWYLPESLEHVANVRTQPEPATEFRIRKHGTALREVRGIPFASQQEAEQAVSRYTPGSVYEIVEVKVVRTVKVEQEVRVIDYKEAA